MNLGPKKDEYYWIVEILTDEIYSAEKTRTKNRRILNTMAQIRNTLQDGIHNSKYEFE